MTNLQRLLEIISTAPASTASTETLIAASNLTMTQISEAIRPAIKSGEVTKEGKGKTATYALPVKSEEPEVEFTEEEMMMLAAFYQTSTDTCGACNEDENMSYMNANDLYETLGLSKQKISIIMKSLDSKGAITDTEESARKADITDWVINTWVAEQFAKELEAIEIETKDRNLVTLLSICLEHDVEPMLARRKLRKANVEKPGKQWSWAQDFDLSGIIKIITK